MRILVLCTGNSCRSQMAHGFLESFDNTNLVRSAGTDASGKLNPRAVAVMEEVGIDISHHTSDPVDKYIDQEWDCVITVCDGAKETCPVFSGSVVEKLHMSFEDPSEVIGPDEFVWSEFRRVRDEIHQTFKSWYEKAGIS